MAVIATCLTSCNEDPEYFELPTYPDQMHIKASTDSIVFNKGKANETAITFSWDEAVSPISATDSVTYRIAFYDTNQKADHISDYIELGMAKQVSFTHDELNSIVARWVLPGQPLSVTAQLMAEVHNPQKYVRPIKSTVSFVATCYEKYPTYMYMRIIDPATGNLRTERMEQPTLGTGIYAVTLDVTPCDFYFLTTTENYPAYGMAAGVPAQPGVYKMEYFTSGDVTPFSTMETGRRTIIIDTNAEYNDYRMYLPLPSTMMPWMTGSATDYTDADNKNNWHTNEVAARFAQPDKLRNPYIYTWTGNLYKDGEFKIGLGSGWSDMFFFAPSDKADPLQNQTLLPYRLQDAGGDLKWVPTASGNFTITLSLLIGDMWIKTVAN